MHLFDPHHHNADFRLANQANEASLHHSSGTDACFLLHTDTVEVWIGRSQFRHETAHSRVCGSSWVTGSWVLGRGISAELFQMFLVLWEQQSQVLSGYIVFRRKQGARQGDWWAAKIFTLLYLLREVPLRGFQYVNQWSVVSMKWFIWVGSIGQRSSTWPAGPRFPSVSDPNVVADRCMTL